MEDRKTVLLKQIQEKKVHFEEAKTQVESWESGRQKNASNAQMATSLVESLEAELADLEARLSDSQK